MIEFDIPEKNIDHKWFWNRSVQNPKFSWKHNNTLSLIFSFLIATFYWNVLKCSLKQYALLTDNFGRFMCTQTYFGDQISNIVILKNTSCTQNRLLCCYKNPATMFVYVHARLNFSIISMLLNLLRKTTIIPKYHIFGGVTKHIIARIFFKQ